MWSSRHFVHLPLAARTFSFARLRYFPHSMACFSASPSAFKTALCSVWIWPTNARALVSLDLGIAFSFALSAQQVVVHDFKQPAYAVSSLVDPQTRETIQSSKSVRR